MLGVSSVADPPVSDTLDPEQPFGKLMRQAQNPFAVLQVQGATGALVLFIFLAGPTIARRLGSGTIPVKSMFAFLSGECRFKALQALGCVKISL
jgi:hypothetical protein